MQKLKIKFKRFFANKTFLFPILVGIFVLGIIFFQGILTAKAQLTAKKVDPGSIQFKMDTEINGKNDNLVKVVKGNPIKIKAIVTVTAASESGTIGGPIQDINYGVDVLDFNTTIDRNRILKEIGVGIEPAQADKTSCDQKIVSNFIVWKDNTTYIACNFFAGSGVLGANGLKIGQSYPVEISFVINDTTINGMGLDKPCPRNSSKTPCLTVYPYVFMDKIGIDRKIAVSTGGKDVYVQYYNSQTEMDADTSRPTDIPAYGSVQGNLGVGATGSGLVGFINQIIGIIVGAFNELIYLIFYLVVAPLLQAMLSISTYKDTFVAVIYPGWEIIRNICNIIFIVAMIAIGLGTILRVDSYNYKHLLVNLILAALLINFSLVIGQIILGIADTVQNQFLPNNQEVIRALAKDLMLAYRSETWNLNYAQNGFWGNTFKPLFFLAMATGSFMIFVAIAAFLFIRIVMLWILLMVSPIAYAAGVLPSTASFRQTWWSNFIKYAFFTPVMAFFLNLTAVISAAYKNTSILQTVTSADLQNSDLAAFVFRLASNVILLVFLMVAIQAADKFGIYGASELGKMAKGGLMAPFAGAGWLGKTGYKNFQLWKWNATKAWSQETEPGKSKVIGGLKRIAFTAVNPEAVKKAFEKDFEKKYHRAEHAVEAAGLDVKRQTPGFKEVGMPSELAEVELHALDEISKERPYSGNEELEVDLALNLFKLAKTSEKYRPVAAAKFLQLIEEKGGNALLAKSTDDEGKPFEWTRESMNAYLNKMVKDGVFSKQMAGELNNRISKIAYETKQRAMYEGVYRHGVHPGVFETEKVDWGDEKGKVWRIAGQNDYEALRNFSYSKLDSAIVEDKEVAAQFLETTKGLDGLAKEEAEKTFKASLLKQMMKDISGHSGKWGSKYGHDFEEAFQKDKKYNPDGKASFNHDRYHNFEAWKGTMDQRDSNLTKRKGPNDALSDVHWNSVTETINGATRLQSSALVDFYDIKEGEKFQAGRGLQPKVLAGLERAIVTYKDLAIKDFENEIRRRTIEAGEKMPSDAEITEMAKKKVADLQTVIDRSKYGATTPPVVKPKIDMGKLEETGIS